jgi:hypothetical protein
MIALLLQDALAKRMRGLFDGWTLPSKGGARKGVRVFTQFLPLPQAAQSEGEDGPLVFGDSMSYGESDLESNFPCVLVKVDEGTERDSQGADATRVKVRLLVGVYDDSADCQGYRDAMNIIEAVRLNLMTDRYLEMKYRLEMPLNWHIFDEQPWPVFFAGMETTWEMGRIAERIPNVKGGDWRDGEYTKDKRH